MTTATIIPDFDVVEDCSPSSLTRRKTMVHTFRFERGEEAFHGGVVVTVASAAHADGNTVSDQQALIVGAGVLAAPVGVVQQTCLRAATLPVGSGITFCGT